MVEELGSILVFAGRPIPNHTGTKFIFLQYRTIGSRTNDSWGLYVQDVSTGKRQLIDELFTSTWEESWVYDQIRTFGWSPDDRYFAYARNGMKEVVVYDAIKGKGVGIFPAGKAWTSGDWLTTQQLAITDGEQIFEFTQIGEQWQGPTNFATVTGGLKGVSSGKSPIESLQASSSSSLLWRQGVVICSSRQGDVSEIVWQMPGPRNELVDFSCAKETPKILVHGREYGPNKRGDFLPIWRQRSARLGM